MNFKSVFLILSLLVFVFGISAVCAESVSVEGIDFEIPQGYSVEHSNNVSFALVREDNENYSIFLSMGNFSDLENAQNSREISGFKFLSDEHFLNDNNVNIVRQNYIRNDSYYSFYSFELDGEGYLLGYTFPVHDEFVENETNPVDGMIENLGS